MTLISSYRFNNNGTDDTGAHNLTLNNESFVQNSKEGSHAISFNGTNSYANIGSIDLDKNFTISAWVYIPSGTSDTQTIIANTRIDQSVYNGFSFAVNAKGTGNGQIMFYVGKNNGQMNSASSNENVFEFDSWQHLAVTVNNQNGTALIYYNGVDVTVD